MSSAFDDGINPPLKQLEGNMYAMYSGDVNQDGAIDLLDINSTENDAADFLFGYNVTDCNGDGATDLLDINTTENNASLFIFYARPY
jgi:hypothetical protein